MLPFKLVYHPSFSVDLGPHVFPAQKYRLARERLLREGVADAADFVEPAPASRQDVLRVHTPDYVRKMTDATFSATELRTLELPFSLALRDATWRAAGGAILAGRLARRDRCAILLGGGFHHAFADHGEGFCLVNDTAIAIAALRAAGEARRVAVVDLDVHQGNGTAALLGRDPDAFTVSLHQQDNYPASKPPSSVDVGLPDGTDDAGYLDALETPLRRAFEFGPDLVFYLAGADPYAFDRLGGLGLTREGLRRRDRRVLAAARDAGTPLVASLAGGYALLPEDTVAIHVDLVRVAAEVFASD